MLTKLRRWWPKGRLPRHQRQSYRHELGNAMTFPVVLALLEGAVVSVIAKSIFDVGNFAFAAINAAPMFANLTSTLWSRLSRGRRKVPFICALMTGIMAINVAIALLPLNVAGGVALVVLIVLARCMVAGIIAVRSTIWRTNYPRRIRGQITGKFILSAAILFSIAPLIGYAVADLDPFDPPIF